MMDSGTRPDSFGSPERRWPCHKTQLFVWLACWMCFALSIIAIQPMLGPTWSLSWELGLTNQLVVIGLLLSLMNICTGVLAPTFFLILETRRKAPTLQNYEALMKNSLVGNMMDKRWRASILLLILLPLGLSAGYKKTGFGKTSIEIQSQFPRYYGLVPLPLGTLDLMSNSIFYMINASVPYITASQTADSTPRFPAVYGFNTILLDDTSTALLDLPAPDFLSSVQQSLTGGESWTISAAVTGTIARYNDSISLYRDDDAFWTNILDHSYNPTALSAISLYNGYQLGLINGLHDVHAENPGPFCLLGFFKGDTWGLHTYREITEPAILAFRQSANMFDLSRERCQGQWKVTSSSIQLVSGSCTGERTKQEIFNSTTPYYVDALPLLSQWLSRYTPKDSQSQSPWMIPSMTTSVVSMFWSRIIYTNPTNNEYPELHYPPADEIIRSTRLILDTNSALYLILSIHPIVCTLMLLSICICYRTPIGKNFGLISVLAGIRKESLNQLRGAGLSGTLTKAIHLHVVVQKGSFHPRVRYVLGDNLENEGHLDIKETYN